MENKLVNLTVVYSIIEAKVIVSMLESAGIFAFAPTELAGNVSHLMTALGGIEIKVVDSDLEAARSLLAATEEPEHASPAQPKSPLEIAGEVAQTFLFGVPPAPAPPRSRKTDTGEE